MNEPRQLVPILRAASMERAEQEDISMHTGLLAAEIADYIEALEKEKTQLEHRLRLGPPSGRGALSAHEREELREIAEARATHPATKRVAELIFVVLDVLEQTER